MHSVYIGLGSNLGDSLQHLQSALKAMSEIPETTLVATSSAYSSAPLGPADQPRYLNAVAQLHTSLSPLVLLDALQSIELQHGRVRIGERWGPRTLDLDIILFDNLIIDEPRLVVPHYHMHARPFVLYPLAELCDEDFVLPDGKSLAELLTLCPPDTSLTRLASPELLA